MCGEVGVAKPFRIAHDLDDERHDFHTVVDLLDDFSDGGGERHGRPFTSNPIADNEGVMELDMSQRLGNLPPKKAAEVTYLKRVTIDQNDHI